LVSKISLKTLSENFVVGTTVIHIEHPMAFSDRGAAKRKAGAIRRKYYVDLVNRNQSSDETRYGLLFGLTVVVFIFERDFFSGKFHTTVSVIHPIDTSQDEFVALFKKALGKDIIPDYHAAEAGAQVLAYVLAVEKTNSTDSKNGRAALGDLTFMSFYGGWDVDDTGMQVGHSMVDVQWQGGKRVIVWPEEAQTGKPYYPIPTFADKAKGKKAMH